jgi:hypothetical protein
MIPEQPVDDQLNDNDDVGWCYMKNDYISAGFTTKTALMLNGEMPQTFNPAKDK